MGARSAASKLKPRSERQSAHEDVSTVDEGQRGLSWKKGEAGRGKNKRESNARGALLRARHHHPRKISNSPPGGVGGGLEPICSYTTGTPLGWTFIADTSAKSRGDGRFAGRRKMPAAICTRMRIWNRRNQRTAAGRSAAQARPAGKPGPRPRRMRGPNRPKKHDAKKITATESCSEISRA